MCACGPSIILGVDRGPFAISAVLSLRKSLNFCETNVKGDRAAHDLMCSGTRQSRMGKDAVRRRHRYVPRLPPPAMNGMDASFYIMFCQSISRFPSVSFRNAEAPYGSNAIGPSVLVSLLIFSALWNFTPFALRSSTAALMSFTTNVE